jgi:hypothetical protein
MAAAVVVAAAARAAAPAAVVAVAAGGSTRPMLSRRDRRAYTSWIAKRHDPRASWEMYRADADRNDGTIPPLEEAQRVLRAVKSATAHVLAASGGLGIGANAMNVCAVLAAVTARVATEQTGNVYRVQSGRWWRVTGVEGGRIAYFERTGSGDDFHTWCVSAHPRRQLAILDAQAMWWEPETVVWDWQAEENSRGLAWRAHTATTAKVSALADEHADVVDAIHLMATALLDQPREAAA